MESNPYEKTSGGGGSSTVTSTSESAAAADAAPHGLSDSGEAELCRHSDARGHRCRMLVTNDDDGLCAHHARRKLRASRIDEAAEELLASGTDFGDAAAVNRFLGALVRQVALKRIPRRDAVTP
jgi:hypothetical protein